VEASQIRAWLGNQRGEAGEEIERAEHNVCCAVLPWPFSSENAAPGAGGASSHSHIRAVAPVSKEIFRFDWGDFAFSRVIDGENPRTSTSAPTKRTDREVQGRVRSTLLSPLPQQG
jgi:hypothetical protein